MTDNYTLPATLRRIGDEMTQMWAEIDRLRAERDEHERARTALEEAVGQVQAEAAELREALLAKHNTGEDR